MTDFDSSPAGAPTLATTAARRVSHWRRRTPVRAARSGRSAPGGGRAVPKRWDFRSFVAGWRRSRWRRWPTVQHGTASFLIGESGRRLLEWKLTRDAAVARRLFEAVEGNLDNPVRDQLWAVGQRAGGHRDGRTHRPGSLGSTGAARGAGAVGRDGTHRRRRRHLGLGAEPLRPCRDVDRRRPRLRRQRLPGGARRGLHHARTARRGSRRVHWPSCKPPHCATATA